MDPIGNRATAKGEWGLTLNEAWRHRLATAAQLARFGASGLMTTGIYLVSTQVLHRYGLSLTSAASISFCIVVLISYLVNYSWTFRSDQHHSVAVRRFTLMVVAGWVINGVTVALGSRWPGSSPTTILLAGIGLVVTWNYFVSRFWVFARPESKFDVSERQVP